MSQSTLPKKLVIREPTVSHEPTVIREPTVSHEPNENKYIMGKNSDKVTLTFKIFMKKRQSRASKTLTLNTTLGELRKEKISYWEPPIYRSSINTVDSNVIYISKPFVIKHFLKMFEKLGSKVEIPKKFNYNIDFYTESIYDVLLTSTRPYNLNIV